MSDRYLEFAHTSFGQTFSNMLGLPKPPRLKRATNGYENLPLQGCALVVGASRNAQFLTPAIKAVKDAGAILRVDASHSGIADTKAAAKAAGAALVNNPATGEGEAARLALFDASGVETPDALREVYDFFKPLARSLPSHSHVVVLVASPDEAQSSAQAASRAALRGFVRSFAKELGRNGSTANLIEVRDGGEDNLAGPLRFFLTGHSAFITGQGLTVARAASKNATAEWVSPLAGKTALVTGAARGIGAAIAETLGREGAKVIGLDRVQEEAHLAASMAAIDGVGMTLDITEADAPSRIAEELGKIGDGVDVVVHNAGITRDKMLRNMKPEFWDMVLDVNLGAITRINETLLDGVIRDGGRMVCISSIGGIAGNAGQTNYGATKSGIIGYVASLAETLADKGIAANAVAPGFIETQMTASMPVVHREVGRRLNSLSQGGLPIDIAEAVTFLGSNYAAGINGQTLRVCGQNWVGA